MATHRKVLSTGVEVVFVVCMCVRERAYAICSRLTVCVCVCVCVFFRVYVQFDIDTKVE